jgi:hypothetical protein
MERTALKTHLVSRGVSAAVVLAFAAGGYALHSVYGTAGAVAWAPLAIATLAILTLSPLGTFMSVFTLWSGYWVDSCPNCPAVGVSEMRTGYLECDSCGERAVVVEPVVGPGWVAHRRDGAVEHSCGAGARP